MSNPNIQLPTFAEAAEKQLVERSIDALYTLFAHYDLDNMSERELRTLHGQLGDIQTRLDEYANDVLYAAEECEPEPTDADDESQDEIDRQNNAAFDASDSRFMKAGW